MKTLGFALALASFAGCGDDTVGVHVCVDGDSSHFDAVDIELTFAADLGGPVCTPAVAHVGPGALPYCVLVTEGARYTHSVVVRATGYQGADVAARRQYTIPFQRGKLVEQTVNLDPSCGICAPETECAGRDECSPVSWPNVFDGGGAVMDPVECVTGRTE